MKERKAYQTHRERSRHSPDEVTTIIIDGMDQSKTNLPHFVVHDKDTKGLAKLRVHLTGVILHSGYVGEKKPYIFRDLRQLPHDSNLTLNCLLRVLHQNRDQLGKTLFLQLDNCFRENKNVYLLSFAFLLVELKAFKEVFVHFLPVGHTHEDIDQMFSRISVRLSKTNALFLDDLDRNISDSYSPNIEVEEVKDIFNIKDWIKPCIAGHFGNHSKPHWFWFHMVDGKTVMHYKLWVEDAWRPTRDEATTSDMTSDGELSSGLICLKEIPDVTQTPAWVIPITERMEPDALLRDIPGKYAKRLPTEVCKKWEEFLMNVKTYEEVPEQASTWMLMDLSKDDMQPIAEPVPRVEDLANIVNRECPNVVIGRQGRIPTNMVTHVPDFSTIKVGLMVAVHLEDSSSRPYIGTVAEKEGDHMTVHWFQGSWLKSWKPWYLGVGRNRVPYSTRLPLDCAILWDFQLTPKGCLKKNTVQELKDKYAELDIQQ